MTTEKERDIQVQSKVFTKKDILLISEIFEKQISSKATKQTAILFLTEEHTYDGKREFLDNFVDGEILNWSVVVWEKPINSWTLSCRFSKPHRLMIKAKGPSPAGTVDLLNEASSELLMRFNTTSDAAIKVEITSSENERNYRKAPDGFREWFMKHRFDILLSIVSAIIGAAVTILVGLLIS